MSEGAPLRQYTLRALVNGVRYLVRAGCHWRMMPHDLPTWQTVHQQAQRRIAAGGFGALAKDLRNLCTCSRSARRSLRP